MKILAKFRNGLERDLDLFDTDRNPLSWIRSLQSQDVDVEQRSKIDFKGAGVVVTDDEDNDRTVVEIDGGGGSAALPWTNAVMGSHWETGFDPDFSVARYRKTPDGEVVLDGIARVLGVTGSSIANTNDVTILSLPDGVKPAKRQIFIVEGMNYGPNGWASNGAQPTRVDIFPSGNLSLIGDYEQGTAAAYLRGEVYLSLAGIRFYTD